MGPMDQRWTRLGVAATGALALPAVLAVVSSGSCSLADLYSGARDGGGGASTGSSGSGGGDAGADGPPSCPSDMVAPGTSAYCIDKLEVNNFQYAGFLAAKDAGGPQMPKGKCDWNTSYEPHVAIDAGDDLPVLGVDWCDAYAYCLWANRRLCGKSGGGSIAPGSQNFNTSQWYHACSANDTRTYPYPGNLNLGDCADCNPAMGCNPDASSPDAQAVPVGSKTKCEGGYLKLFDMSGNAAEWEDGCDDAGVRPDASDDAGKPIPEPRLDNCYHRGGSFDDHVPACLACSTQGCPSAAEARSHHPTNVGFRCCLDL
jgi:formylglycine-generating enzyme required for sulfatase activity